MQLGKSEKFITITDGNTPYFYIDDATLFAMLQKLYQQGILRPTNVTKTTDVLSDQLESDSYLAGVCAIALIRIPTAIVDQLTRRLDMLQGQGGEALLTYPSPTQTDEMDTISEVDTLTPLTARIRHIVPMHYPESNEITTIGFEVDLLIPDLILLFAHSYINLIQPPE